MRNTRTSFFGPERQRTYGTLAGHDLNERIAVAEEFYRATKSKTKLSVWMAGGLSLISLGGYLFSMFNSLSLADSMYSLIYKQHHECCEMTCGKCDDNLEAVKSCEDHTLHCNACHDLPVLTEGECKTINADWESMDHKIDALSGESDEWEHIAMALMFLTMLLIIFTLIRWLASSEAKDDSIEIEKFLACSNNSQLTKEVLINALRMDGPDAYKHEINLEDDTGELADLVPLKYRYKTVMEGNKAIKKYMTLLKERLPQSANTQDLAPTTCH